MFKPFYDLIRLNYAIYPGIADFRSADFLRHYYEARQSRAGPLSRLVNLIVFCGFQLWLPFRVRVVAFRWRLDRAWRPRALAIARARFVDPNDIALFRIEHEDELDHYMRRFEHIAVGRAIARPETDHSALLLDKHRFYGLCRASGIPHPAVMLEWDRGEVDIVRLPQPGEELFAKPTRGSGGRGAFCFTPTAGETPESALHRLVGQLAGCGGKRWIVQSRMRPHPDIADIACNALPTARIISILNEHGQPEIVSTVLRLAATKDAVVDNIGLGGLSAAIDGPSGTLDLACSGMGRGEFATHPCTGRPIDGRVVPDWHAARRLVETAHAAHFADHVMIGWDVGLTAQGPMLLEGNVRPSIILAQRATRMPVGKTRMGALIAHHLELRCRDGLARPSLLLAGA